jgi:hypothetical protein
MRKLSFCGPVNADRKNFIDRGELDADAIVCLRQEDVSDSGILKKRYTLSRERFVPLVVDYLKFCAFAEKQSFCLPSPVWHDLSSGAIFFFRGMELRSPFQNKIK